MLRAGTRPNTLTLNSAISACEKSSLWQKSLQLLFGTLGKQSFFCRQNESRVCRAHRHIPDAVNTTSEQARYRSLKTYRISAFQECFLGACLPGVCIYPGGRSPQQCCMCVMLT